MPGFKNFVTGNTLPETDLDDYLGAQVVMRYATSAARDADASLTAALREGMVCYLVDTDVLAYYSGSAWVEFYRGTARLSHDPLWQQSANISYTKTRTHYRKTGRDVRIGFNLTATSAGTAGSDIAIEVPFAAPAAAVGDSIGRAWIYDVSANVVYGGELVLTTTTFAQILDLVAGVGFKYIGNGTVLTVAAGDVFRGFASYESAA